MNHGIKTILYPVKDAARAKTLFSTLLGAAPHVDSPYYIGFKAGEQEIGLLPSGHATGMTAPVGYFHVDDIKVSLQALLDGGAQLLQAVKDVGAGRLVASVTDHDGNVIGLIQDPAGK